MEEALQLEEFGGLRDAGGVEEERLEARRPGRLGVEDRGVQAGLRGGGARGVGEVGRDLRAGCGQHGGEWRGEPPAGRGAQQHAAADRGVAGLVALQGDRPGQPDAACDLACEGGVDELRVAVAH